MVSGPGDGMRRPITVAVGGPARATETPVKGRLLGMRAWSQQDILVRSDRCSQRRERRRFEQSEMIQPDAAVAFAHDGVK